VLQRERRRGVSRGGELPTSSPLFLRLFGTLFRWWYFRRGFHAVRVSKSGRPIVPDGRPVIVYTNHPSWWDAALFVLIASRRFPDRRHFGPMDAAALERYRFMRKFGVFGIELDAPRGAATFLRTCRAILADRRSMLWITAEGQFTDPRQRPVRLRPGLAHLMRLFPEAAVVPLAIEYAFWNERYPEALFRFGRAFVPAQEEQVTRGDIEAWQRLLEARLEEAMDGLAAESMRRDASLFEPLMRGAAGVGGIYDLWRQTVALVTGRPFQREHGKPES
jgi:1-acyl-sn-glycerol-3-phosphate acyltransferase